MSTVKFIFFLKTGLLGIRNNTGSDRKYLGLRNRSSYGTTIFVGRFYLTLDIFISSLFQKQVMSLHI